MAAGLVGSEERSNQGPCGKNLLWCEKSKVFLRCNRRDGEDKYMQRWVYRWLDVFYFIDEVSVKLRWTAE